MDRDTVVGDLYLLRTTKPLTRKDTLYEETNHRSKVYYIGKIVQSGEIRKEIEDGPFESVNVTQ